jgi:hypothetical protein
VIHPKRRKANPRPVACASTVSVRIDQRECVRFVSEQAQTSQSQLLLENELLTNEVRHLRGQANDLRQKLDKSHENVRRLEAGAPAASRQETPQQREQRALQEQSLEDLRWLLARLDRSPAGPLLRRYGGFKTLKARYL